MLTRLRLENFKSWADTKDIALKPITAFFGANSSGKTSLLQALLLLKQTTDSSDRGLVFHFGNNKTPVDLGDFESVVHAHDTASALKIALDWKALKPFEITDTNTDQPVVQSQNVGFEVAAHQIVEKVKHSRRLLEETAPQKQLIMGEERQKPLVGREVVEVKRLVVDEMSYRVGNAIFGMRPKGKEYELFVRAAELKFVASEGRTQNIPPPDKCYGFPDAVRANFQNAGFLADLEYGLVKRLQHLYYLGPLSAYPKRQYAWSGEQPNDIGRPGELAVAALLASRDQGEVINQGKDKPVLSLEQYVAQWLMKLGLIHGFRIEQLVKGRPFFEVRVRKSPNAPEVLITDVGFGVSQILPVLVLCFYVPEGSTVILEQPELHLHPAVQAGLADVFIDAWKKRGVQILVESHSEHLLNRLQRRIAEERIPKDDVGLFFCEMDEDRSELKTLALDEYGNIKNWPKDFFGDQFGEIAATSKAVLKRQMATS